MPTKTKFVENNVVATLAISPRVASQFLCLADNKGISHDELLTDLLDTYRLKAIGRGDVNAKLNALLLKLESVFTEADESAKPFKFPASSDAYARLNRLRLDQSTYTLAKFLQDLYGSFDTLPRTFAYRDKTYMTNEADNPTCYSQIAQDLFCNDGYINMVLSRVD